MATTTDAPPTPQEMQFWNLLPPDIQTAVGALGSPVLRQVRVAMASGDFDSFARLVGQPLVNRMLQLPEQTRLQIYQTVTGKNPPNYTPPPPGGGGGTGGGGTPPPTGQPPGANPGGGTGSQGTGGFVPYTTPGSDAAMALARQTQAGGMQGLQSLYQTGAQDLPTNTGDIYKSILARSMDTLNTQRTALQRDLEEGTFARGVGLSTISGDMMSRLNRDYSDAGVRASEEANQFAGNEARQNYAARLAGAAQGASTGTAVLSNEENVGLTNAQRQQQGLQFQSAQDTTVSEAAKNRAQQATLQREGFSHADDIAKAQMIALGGSSLATLFGPTVKSAADWANRFFSGGT